MTATLTILETHRDKLSKAATYEEYRDAQLEYINLLIAKERADMARVAAEQEYVGEIATYIKSRWVPVNGSEKPQSDSAES